MEGNRTGSDCIASVHGGGVSGNMNGTGQLSMSQMQTPLLEYSVREGRSLLPPFLMKTYEMVDDPQSNSIISWSPNNTSFIILDQMKFTSDLLPKYFKHSNFSSFVYQLNNYGFKKISWEKIEYGNPWFQAGKKHWLKNIKRRNQHYECESSVQQASFTPSDVLAKFRMDEELETLRAEQNSLKMQIQKLRQEEEEMVNELKTFQDSIKRTDSKHDEMVIPLLVQQFIQHLREKREMGGNETTKKQTQDTSRSTNNSVVPADEGANSPQGADGKEQVQEESIELQPEGQIFSSPDDSGSSHQDQKATTMTGNAENCVFWKEVLEDGSERENGGEELAEHPPKFIMKLEDLIASSIQTEGETLGAKPLDNNVEEDHLKLRTV